MSDEPKIKRKRNVDPEVAKNRASKAGKASGAKKDSEWGRKVVEKRWGKNDA